MEKTSLIQPRESEKMDAIFNALEDGWPNAKRNRHIADLYFLWGLIGNNQAIIESGKPFMFVDMPYHGRWLPGSDYDSSYWRVCKNNLHNSDKLKVDDTRFKSWGVELKPMREGEHILICPSSESMTRLIHGVSVEEWMVEMFREIRKHTNRPIKARMKPRKNGTSGPAAGGIPIEEDLKGCHAVVTLASLSAIDALKEGIQVFSNCSMSPSAWCTNRDFSEINKLSNSDDRIELFSNLAWKQYSISEMRSGFCYENIHRLHYN
jgi:hypothetical protein